MKTYQIVFTFSGGTKTISVQDYLPQHALKQAFYKLNIGNLGRPIRDITNISLSIL